MIGGPAFPCDVFDPGVDGPEQHEGMSLRDYFAARAMQSIVSVLHKGIRPADLTLLAKDAYNIADAMLTVRGMGK